MDASEGASGDWVARRIVEIAGWAQAVGLPGRGLSVDALIGDFDRPVHLAIVGGRIVDASPGPILMRPWRFSYRATPQAWAEFWQPMPAPGWHDLLSLTKRGAARLEGDLHPFMANLQAFKDLLALPRGRAEGAA